MDDGAPTERQRFLQQTELRGYQQTLRVIAEAELLPRADMRRAAAEALDWGRRLRAGDQPSGQQATEAPVPTHCPLP